MDCIVNTWIVRIEEKFNLIHFNVLDRNVNVSDF